MSTVNRETAISTIKKYEKNHKESPHFSIWIYTNAWGQKAFKLCKHRKAQEQFLRSKAVNLPMRLFTSFAGVTELGKRYLT